MPIHQLATASTTILIVKALWAGAAGTWIAHAIFDALSKKYKAFAWKILASVICTAIAWAM